MSKIVLESTIVNDEYTEFLYDNYDIQTKEKIVTEIPMIDMSELETFNWNIGLVVGESGSGKSTILGVLGQVKTPQYNYDKCVVSQFPNLTPEEVEELLHGVGLSSIPTHLKKVNELSFGQKARLDVAWQLNNAKEGEIILIDEFSSVLDRPTSKALSFSIQRYCRKHNLQVILASCHYDIIEDEEKNHYLQPDWIFNLNLRDKNNECELERFIYSDDKEYEVFKKIKDEDILSEKKNI